MKSLMKIITSLVQNWTWEVEFQPDSDQDSSDGKTIIMKKKRQREKAYQADIGVFKNSGKEGSNIHFEVS